jgi:hypothetical protein
MHATVQHDAGPISQFLPNQPRLKEQVLLQLDTCASCTLPMPGTVRPKTCASCTLPMPGTLRSERPWTNSLRTAGSSGRANCPFGLLMSEATLASMVLGPRPTLHVSCVSILTLYRICSATSAPGTEMSRQSNSGVCTSTHQTMALPG